MIIKLALYIIFTVGGLTFIKMGSEGLKLSFSLTLFNFQIPGMFLLGIVCYGLSFLLWIWIISTNNLSFIYPLSLGICYIATMLVSIFILNESITIYSIVGASLILIGVIFMLIK